MRQLVPKHCIQWREKLANIYLHNLTRQEQHTLTAHIATCPPCASVWAEYQAMDVAIKHLPPVQPVAELPVALAALISKYRGKETMLKKNHYHDDMLKVIDLDVQLARKYKQTNDHEEPRRSSRLVRLLNSLAAALIVSFIAIGALLLFTDRSPSEWIGGASLIPQAASPILYTSLESKGPAGNATIYAVDSANGQTLWSSALKTRLTTSELLPHKDLLFAPGYDGNLYALSAKNGEILWKYSVRNDPTLKSTDAPSSPIASGNAVYFGAGSGFYALDIQTGKQLWHVKPLSSCKPAQIDEQGNPTAATCSLVIGAVANGRAYAYFDGLYALDAETGKELWRDLRFQFRGPGSVVVTGDNVYVTNRSNDLFILNASNGKGVVTNALISSPSSAIKDVGGTLLVDGVVYHADAGGLQAVSGTEILWSKLYQAIPIAGNAGTLFVTSSLPLDGPQEAGDLGTYFYALDAKTGAIQWHWGEKSSDGSWVPGYPLSIDGKLYFFFPVQQDGKFAEALWVLHDGKRDLYPLKEG